MSQTALGTAVGITFQQIQKYEKGTNRIGSSRLQQLADTLKVPVSALFGEQEPDEQIEIFRFLAEPGAIEILRSYASIDDDQYKRAVLSIVRSIARISVKPPLQSA